MPLTALPYRMPKRDSLALEPSKALNPDFITARLISPIERKGMTLPALRWLTVALPFLFLAILDILRHATPLEFLHTWPASIVPLGLVVGGIALFSKAVLDQVEAAQRRVIQQNQELTTITEAARTQAAHLRGLHNAGLALAADLSLDTVLQRVVDLARELSGARYGALGVFDENKRIQRFITAGITPEERARMGQPPQGLGLLGEVLKTNAPVRVRDISSQPAFIGFPPGHPEMTSFLGVPISYKGQVLGNLYLTNKQDAPEFTEADSTILELFAAQAAVAIENARLHAQVQLLVIEEERQRIAREMHDGLAQILGYVNVKAGAARRLVDLGRVGEAARELQQLEDAAREVYAEVREAILGLRTVLQGENGLIAVLTGYLERFSEQSGIPVDLKLEGEQAALSPSPEAEVQLIRIIQEALSNVRKHASASKASVCLRATPEGTLLVVEDDGKGFTADRPSPRGGPQFGLQTMRERAEAMGGSFSIDSGPGRGTRVTVQMPRRRIEET